MKSEERFKSILRSQNRLVRIFLAECLGTFVLVFVGIGADLYCDKIQECSSVHRQLAGGFGVMLSIYIGWNASGGHTNPAVTIAFWTVGRLGNGFINNTFIFLWYSFSQVTLTLLDFALIKVKIIGGFIAACFAYWIYLPYFEDQEPSGIICSLATCPGNSTPGLMILEQAIAVSLIVLCAFSTADPRNALPPGLAPFMIGIIAMTVGLTFSNNSG